MRRMKADSEEWLQKQEAAGLYLMQCIADLAQLSPEAVEPATKGVVELSRDAWSAMTPEERTALLRKLLMSMQVGSPRGACVVSGGGTEACFRRPSGFAASNDGSGTTFSFCSAFHRPRSYHTAPKELSELFHVP